MPPTIATAVWGIGLLALFALDRRASGGASKALWIPVCWVSLAGSRMVSGWFGMAVAVRSAEQAGEGNALDRNVLASLIGIGVIVLVSRRREVQEVLRRNPAVAAYVAYCGVSVLWADYPDVAFKRWVKSVGDVVMVLIVLTEADRRGAVRAFLSRIGFLLVPTSILLIKYYPEMAQAYSGAEGNVRYTGVATDKNMLGAVCMVVGLACVWQLLDAARNRRGERTAGPVIVQIAMLAMILWLFRVSNSMTSLACFILAACAIVCTGLGRVGKGRGIVHAQVAAVLGSALAVLFLGFGSGLVERMGRDATLTGRTELWQELLRLNRQPLFGTGFENFWLGTRLEELWELYWWHPNEAHNGYLEVFLNLGVVGVVLLALVMLNGYWNIVKSFDNDRETTALRLGYFIAGTVYGFTEAAFRVLNPVWFVFLMALMMTPRRRLARRHSGAELRQGGMVPVTPGERACPAGGRLEVALVARRVLGQSGWGSPRSG